MCNENLKHAPIMPIAAKPSQYGIDRSITLPRAMNLRNSAKKPVVFSLADIKTPYLNDKRQKNGENSPS